MEALPAGVRTRSAWRWLGYLVLCTALLLVETPVYAQATITAASFTPRLVIPQLGAASLVGAVGGVADPAATAGILFTISPSNLTPSVTSSDQGVLPNGNLLLTSLGNGLWCLQIKPEIAGAATVTLSAGAASYQVFYTVLVDNGDGTATLSGTPGAFDVGIATVQLDVQGMACAQAVETFLITVAPEQGTQSVYLPLIESRTATGPLPIGNPVTLVPAAAEWKYWDQGTMPADVWQPLGFDDSAWPTGPAPLGYGNANDATQLDFGGDANNKYISYYFRHVFTVDDPAAFKALDLQLLRDDGAVVYLNGQEVVRSNMPAGPVMPQTLAQGAAVEDLRYQYTVDPNLLVAGSNVLAVEIHQAAVNSSDITFGLTLLATPTSVVRFAVIGDYGKDGLPEADVAARLKSWRPDFVITTGDNNYNVGAADTIDANIFKHYGEFITDDPNTTRFFPSLGNHDWITDGAAPYLDRFVLPGNERYYDFVRGNVHFFVVDSDMHEPDGVSPTSAQGQWLESTLDASNAAWKIVYFHHPPYSSGVHGSQAYMQWPFTQWGATAVLTGHEHNYERLVVDDMLHFVNGLGGQAKRNCKEPMPLDLAGKSRICYDDDYGAMLVEAGDTGMTFYFIARDAAIIDACTLPGTCK